MYHKTVPQIVISPEDTSTVAGSTTVLACVGYGSPSVTWSKDGAVLVNNSQVTIFEDLVTRGGLTFTKSVLQLCDTQDVNSGPYSCSIESIQMNDSATFELSVTPNVGTLWVFITRSTPTCTRESIRFVQARRHGEFEGVRSPKDFIHCLAIHF